MEEKCKRCYMCRNFEKYYTKGQKQFIKTKYGWCYCKAQIISTNDTCNKWHYKRSKKCLSWAAKNALNNILLDIKAIRQIIEEEIEDEKLQ